MKLYWSIFVGNLPLDFLKSEIKLLFSLIGDVKYITCFPQKCFVDFETISECDKAISTFNGAKFRGDDQYKLLVKYSDNSQNRLNFNNETNSEYNKISNQKDNNAHVYDPKIKDSKTFNDYPKNQKKIAKDNSLTQSNKFTLTNQIDKPWPKYIECSEKPVKAINGIHNTTQNSGKNEKPEDNHKDQEGCILIKETLSENSGEKEKPTVIKEQEGKMLTKETPLNDPIKCNGSETGQPPFSANLLEKLSIVERNISFTNSSTQVSPESIGVEETLVKGELPSTFPRLCLSNCYTCQKPAIYASECCRMVYFCNHACLYEGFAAHYPKCISNGSKLLVTNQDLLDNVNQETKNLYIQENNYSPKYRTLFYAAINGMDFSQSPPQINDLALRPFVPSLLYRAGFVPPPVQVAACGTDNCFLVHPNLQTRDLSCQPNPNSNSYNILNHHHPQNNEFVSYPTQTNWYGASNRGPLMGSMNRTKYVNPFKVIYHPTSSENSTPPKIQAPAIRDTEGGNMPVSSKVKIPEWFVKTTDDTNKNNNKQKKQISQEKSQNFVDVNDLPVKSFTTFQQKAVNGYGLYASPHLIFYTLFMFIPVFISEFETI